MHKTNEKILGAFLLLTLSVSVAGVVQAIDPGGDPGGSVYTPMKPSISNVHHTIESATEIRIYWSVSFDDSRYGIQHYQRVEIREKYGISAVDFEEWGYGQAHDGNYDAVLTVTEAGEYEYSVTARSKYQCWDPPDIWWEYSLWAEKGPYYVYLGYLIPEAPEIHTVDTITHYDGPYETIVTWSVTWSPGTYTKEVRFYWGTDSDSLTQLSVTGDNPYQAIAEDQPRNLYYYKIYARAYNPSGSADDTYGPTEIPVGADLFLSNLNDLDLEGGLGGGGDHGWSRAYQCIDGDWLWDARWLNLYQHVDDYANAYVDGEWRSCTQLKADRKSTEHYSPKKFFEYRQINADMNDPYKIHLDFWLREDSIDTISSVDNWRIAVYDTRYTSGGSPLWEDVIKDEDNDEHGTFQHQLIDISIPAGNPVVYLLIGHHDSWTANWSQGHTKYFNEISVKSDLMNKYAWFIIGGNAFASDSHYITYENVTMELNGHGYKSTTGIWIGDFGTTQAAFDDFKAEVEYQLGTVFSSTPDSTDTQILLYIISEGTEPEGLDSGILARNGMTMLGLIKYSEMADWLGDAKGLRNVIIIIDACFSDEAESFFDGVYDVMLVAAENSGAQSHTPYPYTGPTYRLFSYYLFHPNTDPNKASDSHVWWQNSVSGCFIHANTWTLIFAKEIDPDTGHPKQSPADYPAGGGANLWLGNRFL